VAEQLASFYLGHQPAMSVGFVLEKNTRGASPSGFVLLNSVSQELLRFIEHRTRPRVEFVLAIQAPSPELNYLFSSRSTNLCCRTRVLRFRLITAVHSNVKARNASRAASTHISLASDCMAKFGRLARVQPAGLTLIDNE
jgi:hypothetical protein